MIVSYLGDQVCDVLGSGGQLGVTVRYVVRCAPPHRLAGRGPQVAGGLLPDGESEAGKEVDPRRAREARGAEERTEAVRSVEADPARIGPARDRRAQLRVPLRTRIDDAVDASRRSTRRIDAAAAGGSG